MRVAAVIGTLLLLGCNSILGIHDLPPSGTPDAGASTCSDGCACAIDSDCGTHMFCDIEPTSSSCDCVAGYSAGSGACAWTGVIANPGFTATTAWSLGSGTAIDPTYTTTGMLDLGAAETPFPAPMNGQFGNTSTTAEVSQSFVMPRLSRAEPLVAEVSMSVVGQNQSLNSSANGLGIGAGWNEDSMNVTTTTWDVSRVCLGAAQYAPESTSGSGTLEGLDATTTVGVNIHGGQPPELDYDHVDIVEAGSDECPAPGTVINGDAEGSGGWTFSASPANTNDGMSIGYVAGAGAAGSRGVQVSAVQYCDQAEATVPISVALPGTSGTALSLYHHQTGGTLSIYLNDETLELSDETGGVVDRYCMPAPAQGVVTTVYTYFDNDGGTCGSGNYVKADLDDVAVAPEPMCALGSGVIDPGFESGLGLMNVTVANGDIVATVDDGDAPEGVRYLKLAPTQACDQASWSAFVVTPPAQTATGPALTFQYKASGAGLTVGTTGLAKTSGWMPAMVCLDATVQPGRGQLVPVSVDDQSRGCGQPSSFVAGIDDLAVTTDPSCAPP